MANRPKGEPLSPKDSTGQPNLAGLTYANSDLAFRGNYVFQGNFSGFQIWDVSDPKNPVLRTTYTCATGQGDPSIHGNLKRPSLGKRAVALGKNVKHSFVLPSSHLKEREATDSELA